MPRKRPRINHLSRHRAIMKRRFLARRNPLHDQWMKDYEEEIVYRALLSITLDDVPVPLRYEDFERHWPMRFRRPQLDKALARLRAAKRVRKNWSTWQAIPPADENTDAAAAA